MVGTAELKVADWYMSDSRLEAHCMLPPSVSIFSIIWSPVVERVDLKARRSMM